MLAFNYQSNLGSSESTHESSVQSAMSSARQQLSAVTGAHTLSCGAQLDRLYWAFYYLGAAEAHVHSMTGDRTYALRAIVQILRHDVENAWRRIRERCRL